MSRTLLTAAAIALIAVCMAAVPTRAGKKQEEAPYVYGNPPSWEEFRKIAEADIRMRLIDPESARFRWTGGYHKGELKQGHWIPGYYACGFVNSRNRMGGYVGDRSFVIMIDYGRVVFEIVDDSEVGRATATCASAESKGFFPPVADSADPSSPATTQTISASGLTLRAMPEGAYITAVQADSSGALAGLKPGMVITAVNGIALAAMGEAAAKVVGAAGANAMLTLVDGTTRKLGSGQ